jgi:uncharacterized membrane-anchored protein
MRQLKLSFLLFIFLFFPSIFTSAFDPSIPTTDKEFRKKVEQLNWKSGPAVIDYYKGNAKIKLNNSYDYLDKEDANQYLYWVNGIKFNADYLIVSDDAQFAVYYSNDGYVKIDDWNDVDPEQFLKEMLSNALSGNKERTRNNQTTVKDMKWYKKPTLDKNKDIVYYAFRTTWSDNHETINSSVLLLGRSGHARISISTRPEKFRESILTNVPNIYTFNDNQRYSNFTAGDKVAAAGVATLVAGSLGVKAVKAAGGKGIIGLLKYAWVLLIGIIPFLGRITRSNAEEKKEEYSSDKPDSDPEREKMLNKFRKKKK